MHFHKDISHQFPKKDVNPIYVLLTKESIRRTCGKNLTNALPQIRLSRCVNTILSFFTITNCLFAHLLHFHSSLTHSNTHAHTRTNTLRNAPKILMYFWREWWQMVEWWLLSGGWVCVCWRGWGRRLFSPSHPPPSCRGMDVWEKGGGGNNTGFGLTAWMISVGWSTDDWGMCERSGRVRVGRTVRVEEPRTSGMGGGLTRNQRQPIYSSNNPEIGPRGEVVWLFQMQIMFAKLIRSYVHAQA